MINELNAAEYRTENICLKIKEVFYVSICRRLVQTPSAFHALILRDFKLINLQA